jgi:hypothetical protein
MKGDRVKTYTRLGAPQQPPPPPPPPQQLHTHTQLLLEALSVRVKLQLKALDC